MIKMRAIPMFSDVMTVVEHLLCFWSVPKARKLILDLFSQREMTRLTSLEESKSSKRLIVSRKE
jgi:hypothetical protein